VTRNSLTVQKLALDNLVTGGVILSGSSILGVMSGSSILGVKHSRGQVLQCYIDSDKHGASWRDPFAWSFPVPSII
jgi:hypothetical protein